LLRSCYHPDAIDDHGLVKARRDDFVAWSMRHIREGVARRKRLTTHSVMNVLTDIRDDVADVESQFFASHVEPSDQGIRVDEIHGRYLDQFVRRDGQWKILYRRTVHDWSLRRSGEPPPFTAAMADNLQGSLLPDDPLYMRTDNADITPAEAPNV
jgi:hypothetical protein